MEEVTATPAAEAVETGATGTAESTATDVGTTQPTTDTATSDAGTADTTATAATEESGSDTPDQRRERQREKRRQATPPPAPPEVKTPEQIIAEHEAQQSAVRAANEHRLREQQKFAKRIGDDPADPNNPNGPTRYQQLLAEASTPIPDGDDQFYTEETRALVARVNRARDKLADLDERRGLLNDVYTPAQQAAQLQARDWLGNELENGIRSLGLNVDEIVGVAAQVKDPNAMIPTIVKTMGDKIEARATAPLNEKIADLEDDLAAEKSENDALRRQLGGAAPQALRGGSVASSGAMTREQFMSLPKEQKDEIRRTNPAALEAIYSRTG